MYNLIMNNKINASELQRKGLKRVYEKIDQYQDFIIENNRRETNLYITKYKNNLGKIIQLIRKYQKRLEKIGVTHIDIFGSLAHGRATSKSDIDISFKVKDAKTYSLKNMIIDTNKVKDILKEIPKLDIHNFRSLKKEIRDDISLTGINVF